MMGKLAARDNGKNRQFKPQIYQSRRMGQSRNFYDSSNFDRGHYQGQYRSTVEIGEFNLVDRAEVDQGMNKIIGEEVLEAM